MEFSCFFYDPTNIWNFISGLSAFSKSSLYIWKFLVHILLKPNLKDFEYNLASMWNEHNWMVVWTFFGIAFTWIGMKIDLFQSCSHCRVFQICWHIECSTFTASSFRIWDSSAGIPSPPLALLVIMPPKTHLTSHSRMSCFRWVTTPSWLYRSLRPFLYSSVYPCHLFLISSVSVRSLPFLSFTYIFMKLLGWEIIKTEVGIFVPSQGLTKMLPGGDLSELN